MLDKIISNNLLGFALTIVGTILSLFGIIFSLYVYMKDKTKKRELDEIAKIVGENIDLSDKKDEISHLSRKLSEFNKAVNETIPLRAKKVALYDRLDRELVSLAKCYNNVNSLIDEIDSFEEEYTEIPKELFDKISIEISPRYLLNEKLSRYSSMLFLTSFISRIVSSLPILNNASSIIIVLFFFIEGGYIYKIIDVYIKINDKEVLSYAFTIMLAITSILFALISLLILLVWQEFNYEIIALILAFGLIEVICLIALFFIYGKIIKR